MESDTLKALIESVSYRVFSTKTALFFNFTVFYQVHTDIHNILMGPMFDLKFYIFFSIRFFILVWCLFF